MTDCKSLSGSGDANINQVLYGSGFGADYVANYALETFGASRIEGGGSASLKPDSCHVSKSVSTIGSSETFSELYGTLGGDFAGVASGVLDGDLTTYQSFATDQSVSAIQNVHADGEEAVAYSEAEDAKGNWAGTNAVMEDGTMKSVQTAMTGNSASASQYSEMMAEHGYATSYAQDVDGNTAWAFAHMGDYDGMGNLKTDQGAEAGNSASAGQHSEIEADYGLVESLAWDADGNSAWTGTYVEDFDGEGSLVTYQEAEAGNSAFADQHSEVDGDRGGARSEAEDADGNRVQTDVEMENGIFETFQAAGTVDDGTVAAQLTFAEAERGMAYSWAWDDVGNFAEVGAGMEGGTLTTLQEAVAGNSADAFQYSNIEGDFAWAYCEAEKPNDGYYARVENLVIRNASLSLRGSAFANFSEATASQRTWAEGDFNRMRANSSTKSLEFVGNGSCESDLRAWTNVTGEDVEAIILKCVVG